ncbi:MAG TPA: hypothetical protein VGS41_05020 [Chthonomonadales bacterium]|nr:hypothetical protein [Chthonomonadales bacterium]
MSLIAHLNIACRMPVRLIRELLAAQVGVHISCGEISNILGRIATRGEPLVKVLLKQIRPLWQAVHDLRYCWEQGNGGTISRLKK